jgi:Domain of unknown function (DUF4328)
VSALPEVPPPSPGPAAVGSGAPYGGRVRTVSGPGTAAMVALAAAAASALLWAFTPLASIWATHEAADRGGQTPGTVLILSNVAAIALVGLTHLTAWALLANWLHRVAGNARTLGWSRWSAGLAAAAWFVPLVNWVLPPVIVAGVASASRYRRSGPLVWSWWLAWLAGVFGLLAGTVLTWPAELADLFGKVLDGETVDVDRAVDLFGYQIAGRLPGALLLLAAAVLGIVVVGGVTAAQYDRFDELRAPVVVPAQVTADSAADRLSSGKV